MSQEFRFYPGSMGYISAIWYQFGVFLKTESSTLDYTDHTHGFAKNETQSRLKPTPLWAHPTTLGEQYTETKSAVIYDYNRWLGPYFGGKTVHSFTRYGDIVDHFSELPGITPDYQTKMRLAIKDTKVSLGETLAEYHQSARMFGDFADAAVDAWKVFKGKNIRRKVTPCSVNAAYLMTTYGLNPLANTLYDSLDKLYFALGVPPRKRFYASATKDKTDEFEIDPIYQRPGFKVKKYQRQSKRATAYVTFNTFGRSSAFSFGNPAQIAWELVPYSFVLDWALPIGDYLSALDALTGVSNVIGSVTTKKRYRFDIEAIPDGTHNAIRPGKGERSSHSRSVLGTIPMPALPQWKPSFSWHKVTNGMALIANILQPCRKGKTSIR